MVRVRASEVPSTQYLIPHLHQTEDQSIQQLKEDFRRRNTYQEKIRRDTSQGSTRKDETNTTRQNMPRQVKRRQAEPS